jgi:hypothetical protein
MATGCRCIVLAVLGWLILGGASLPPNQNVKPYATNQGQQSPPAEDRRGYRSYPDKNADACYESPNHDTADLCAQWRATVAAEKSTITTYWGTALGFVSTVLLIVTLVLQSKQLRITQEDRDAARTESAALARDTASALAHAARSAAASYQLVEETKKASELNLRPYVYPAQARMISIDDDLERSPVQVQMLNYGRSIALDVVVTSGILVGAYPPNDAQFTRGFTRKKFVGDVPPGKNIIVTHEMSQKAWSHRKLIEKGDLAIYCDVEISYRDLWGNEHRNGVFCVSTGMGAKVGAFLIQSPPEGYRNR